MIKCWVNGYTAFHYACGLGSTEVAEMMIENAESSNLDFKIKTKGRYGFTAFQLAQVLGRDNSVDLIKRKLPSGTF